MINTGLPINQKKGFFKYENFIVISMFLVYGIIMLDRLTLAFLFPFVAPALKMDNTQISLSMSILGICWGVSAYVFNSISDLLAVKKVIFIVAILVFSFASVGTGMVTTFAALILVRGLMGIAEGPAINMSQVFTAAESTPTRRGLNMGIVQSASLLVGSALGPMLVIGVATAYGWEKAFSFVALPGIIMALIMMKFLKEPVLARGTGKPKRPTMAEYTAVFKQRNVWICLVLAVGMITWYLTSMTFFTLYLGQVNHFTGVQIGIFMGVVGFASFVSQWIVPALSDRFGRKLMLGISAFLTIIAMLAVLFIHSFVLATVVCGILYLGTGFPPMMMAVIPSESVPKPLIATAMGTINLGGEIVGGVLVMMLAGILADKYGMSAPIWVSLAGAVVVFVFTFALKETSPKKLKKMGLVNEFDDTGLNDVIEA